MKGVTRRPQMKPSRVYIVAGILFIIVSYFLWGTVERPSVEEQIERLSLDSNWPCKAELRKNVTKVESYKFPAVQNYITVSELFRKPPPADSEMPTVPIFVTAFSSNHFVEGMHMIDNVTAIIQTRYPSSQLIVYDIGLTYLQRREISKNGNCQIRQFPFSEYPDHVSLLTGYAWKSIIIQTVSQEHPFVLWMDSSTRFLTSDLDPLFAKARKYGVIMMPTRGSIAMRTLPSTFRHLEEYPCTFRKTNEFQGGFLLIYDNQFVSDYFLKPLVSCALTLGCMVPEGNHEKYIHCGKYGQVYHDCHRFDQSVIGILTYRLYNGEVESHTVPPNTVMFYRDEFHSSDYLRHYLTRIF